MTSKRVNFKNKLLLYICVLIFFVTVMLLFLSTSTFAEEYDCAAGWHRDMVISRVEATPSSNGLETIECQDCGRIYRFVLYYDHGHSWGPWINVTPATCTEPGLRRRSCENHSGCAQSEEIRPLGHNFETTATPATCSEPEVRTHTCTRCGYSYTEVGDVVLEREYRREVTVVPTCEEDGEATYTCIHCGDSYIEPIPRLEREFGDWVVEVEATEGLDGLEIRTCVHCDEYRETRVIPALITPSLPLMPSMPHEMPLLNIIDVVAVGSNVALFAFFGMFTIPLILAVSKERRHYAAVMARKAEVAERKKKHDFSELY